MIFEDCYEEGLINKSHMQAVRPQKSAHQTQTEKFQEVLGPNYDRYTQKIKLDTILRENYKTRFKDRVIKLNQFLREVIIKVQLFLTMKISVTNKDNLSLSLFTAFSEFSEMYPSIVCPVKKRKITGYSDYLTYACVTLATTYLNSMAETFVYLEYNLNIFSSEKETEVTVEQKEKPELFSFTPNPSLKWRNISISNNLDDLKIANGNGKYLLACFAHTDGHNISLQFSRTRQDKYSKASILALKDFDRTDIEENFLPCTIDPGRKYIFTASIGHSSNEHQVRRCSDLERRCYTGSRQRQNYVDKLKITKNIKRH
ncbi:hypothetical protein INT48_001629 [Thamnidium elegans]|uniref:Uncharacterized protein n=1 Tax=Thamnidium elegans TaxID=101142 RepID=A0A8H7VSL9_9FUNG|nr:hypothetical protein INT48_001629 [Thamnidium elegans]